VFSGLGSAVSARLPAHATQLRRQALFVAMLVLAYLLFVTPAIQQFSGLASAWKFVVAAMLIAPLAFLMGMPFPLGLRTVGETHRAALPWAWGINGCASVVAAPLTTLLAIELGFEAVMIIAAMLYGAAALAAPLALGTKEETS
ncbi:MAG TPA: SAM-dependent methyltransferase, partial [Bacteroidota bacterium]|nr:SAM-dependent methyltransferase [Bacteroidota bacterium]